MTALTPRQYEIATLAAEGLSNHQIAEQLCVSVPSVKNHLYQAYVRLGIRSPEPGASKRVMLGRALVDVSIAHERWRLYDEPQPQLVQYSAIIPSEPSEPRETLKTRILRAFEAELDARLDRAYSPD